MEEAEFRLITCIVQRGKADTVAKAALAAGAGGVTVYFARGMGLRERLGLLGLAIVPEKEILLVVAKKEETKKLFDAIREAAKLETPGMGIAFVTPVYDVAGLIPAGVTKG
jgi:nitrogen regulatory protein P-II 1